MLTWFLEKNFSESQKEMRDEIISQGFNVKILSCYELPKLELDEYPLCGIFYGSINFIRTSRKLEVVPGKYCNFPLYDCTSYYPKLGKFLLNSHYVLIPFGELGRKLSFISRVFGNELFIRPNFGSKIFDGGIFDVNELASYPDISKMSVFYECFPDTLILISDKKQINDESRFLVVDGKVVAGSYYIIDGEFESYEYLSKDRQEWNFAQKIADDYQPERCFTIDICNNDNGNHLLELNSFSSAGLYSCNVKSVIKEVSKVAIDDYNNYLKETEV